MTFSVHLVIKICTKSWISVASGKPTIRIQSGEGTTTDVILTCFFCVFLDVGYDSRRIMDHVGWQYCFGSINNTSREKLLVAHQNGLCVAHIGFAKTHHQCHAIGNKVCMAHIQMRH